MIVPMKREKKTSVAYSFNGAKVSVPIVLVHVADHYGITILHTVETQPKSRMPDSSKRKIQSTTPATTTKKEM